MSEGEWVTGREGERVEQETEREREGREGREEWGGRERGWERQSHDTGAGTSAVAHLDLENALCEGSRA